jgi:hypothetical protein
VPRLKGKRPRALEFVRSRRLSLGLRHKAWFLVPDS